MTTHYLDLTDLTSHWKDSKIWQINNYCYGSNLTSLVNTTAPPADRELKTTYPKGSLSPSKTPLGGLLFYCNPLKLFPLTEVTFGYQVSFPAGFKFVKEGKMHGVWIGQQGASGGNHISDGASSRIIWRENGACDLYVYVPKAQSPNYKNIPGLVPDPVYGDRLWSTSFKLNQQWNDVSMYVKLNTFSTAGKPNFDGVASLTVNGVTQTYNEMVWSTKPGEMINGIGMETFFGGSQPSWASPVDQAVYWRNFYIKTPN